MYGLAIANGERRHDIAPAVVRQVKSLKRRTVFREEHTVMIDLAGLNHPLTKRQLLPQHCQRAWAEIDFTVLVLFFPAIGPPLS